MRALLKDAASSLADRLARSNQCPVCEAHGHQPIKPKVRGQDRWRRRGAETWCRTGEGNYHSEIGIAKVRQLEDTAAMGIRPPTGFMASLISQRKGEVATADLRKT